jgi:hypothetical protein
MKNGILEQNDNKEILNIIPKGEVTLMKMPLFSFEIF